MWLSADFVLSPENFGKVLVVSITTIHWGPPGKTGDANDLLPSIFGLLGLIIGSEISSTTYSVNNASSNTPWK